MRTHLTRRRASARQPLLPRGGLRYSPQAWPAHRQPWLWAPVLPLACERAAHSSHRCLGRQSRRPARSRATHTHAYRRDAACQRAHRCMSRAPAAAMRGRARLQRCRQGRHEPRRRGAAGLRLLAPPLQRERRAMWGPGHRCVPPRARRPRSASPTRAQTRPAHERGGTG